MDAKKLGPPKNEWRTPPEIVKRIEEVFSIKFTLDPCAAKDNHLGMPNFYTVEDDGLTKSWSGTVWVNPPYDHKWVWVRKAWLEAAKRGVDAWVLIESCTDTEQFHSWAFHGDVYLIKGRIKFWGDDLKPIGNGFRGSILFHFNRLPIVKKIERLELS